MLTGKKVKQQTMTRHRRMLVQGVLTPIVILLLCLGLAASVTYLTVEPAIHPNLHPRLVKFGLYMTHFHPRLCRYCPIAAGVVYVLLLLAKPFAPIYWQMRLRKRRLLVPADLKSGQYLNQSLKQRMPVLLPQAWQILKEVLPGLSVKAPGVRGTHWEGFVL